MKFMNPKELRAGKAVGLVIPDLGDPDKTLSVMDITCDDYVRMAGCGHLCPITPQPIDLPEQLIRLKHLLK